MAKELLERYLERYGDRFVHSYRVLEQPLHQGKYDMKINVYVDYQKLVGDLEEKRFLYQPAYRPYFLVFLAERLEGEQALYAYGHKTLREIMVDNGLKLREEEILYPPSNINVMDDANLLREARIAALKNNCELLITGKSSTSQLDKRELYYDTYHFHATQVELQLLRVDTGEILFETTAKGTAGRIDEDESIRSSIRRAMDRALQPLIEYYRANWNQIFLGTTSYRLLLVGIDEEEYQQLLDFINAHEETQAYARGFFGRTGVLNVETDLEPSDLADYVARFKPPSFQFTSRQGGLLEFEMLH